MGRNQDATTSRDVVHGDFHRRVLVGLLSVAMLLTPFLAASETVAMRASLPPPMSDLPLLAPTSQPVQALDPPDDSAPLSPFVDVEGNVHEESIARLVASQVTLGCTEDGTRYCPRDRVTRGQLATFIVRSLEASGSIVDLPPRAGIFSDTDGSVHEEAIEALAGLGVVTGTAEGTFRPLDPVTRAQMALFLFRAFQLDDAPDAGFADVAEIHKPAVNALAASGITFGCDADGRYYCPNDEVRRDQMASFLMRAIDLATLPMGPEGDVGDEQPDAPLDDGDGGSPTDAEDLPDPDAPPPPDDGDEDFDPIFPAGVHHVDDNVAAIDALPMEALGLDPDFVGLTDASGWESVPALPESPLDAHAMDFSLALGSPSQTAWRPRGSGWLEYRSLPVTVGLLHSYHSVDSRGQCTATVVGRDLILTAAHCVKASNQSAVTRAHRFFPDLHGTQYRYGYWDARRVWLPTPWLNNHYANNNPARFLFDYALIEMHPNARGRIGDVLGQRRILMNASSISQPKYSIGYPTEGWYGQHSGPLVRRHYPVYCWDNDRGRYQHGGGWTSFAWGCYLSGGKSGGPVMASYNGRWYVVSVVSTGGQQTFCTSLIGCNSGRGVWYMSNAYGPEFRNDNRQFGGLWRAANS